MRAATTNGITVPAKRGPGRPKGSTNKAPKAKAPTKAPAPAPAAVLAKDSRGENVVAPGDFGPCGNEEDGCRNRVDALVDPWQVRGRPRPFCVECRKKAIQAKARTAIETLEKKAQDQRDELAQGTLPF